MKGIKQRMKILIKLRIFAERLDMSGQITGQVRKSLLESGEEARHIQCSKLDSPICKTEHPVLTGQRIKNFKKNLRS
jgi:hypothetical protein